MACLRCGRITEFVSELFDTLKNQLRRDLSVPHRGGSRRILLKVSALALVDGSPAYREQHRFV
jgi:hypothetical protein